MEYTVHFQKGTRVGARSLRMVTVTADSPVTAVRLATNQNPELKNQGYRLVRVDYYDESVRRYVRA